jgi:cytochrome oxidase assembly protein ShyY1
VDSWRQLRTGRWVTLSLVALMLVAACALLGRWQYGRSYRPADSYSREPAAVSLDSLDSAAHPLTVGVTNRQVIMSGRYDASHQRLIAGHMLEGAPVLWVVTPLKLADGSAIEVVRGWLTRVDGGLANPADSVVRVTGRLRPLQPSVGSTPPPGYADAVDAGLLRQLGYPARDGYVVRTAQEAPDPLSLQPVPSQAPVGPPGAKQFYLQNAVYTVQWWVFVLLIPVIWYRLFRTDLEARRERRLLGKLPTVGVMTP